MGPHVDNPAVLTVGVETINMVNVRVVVDTVNDYEV